MSTVTGPLIRLILTAGEPEANVGASISRT